MFNLTGGLVLPPDTDTGLTFITKSNIGPYLSTKTTYAGSTGANSPTLVPRSGPINNPIATTST
jgi:simple sugar transport system substrate-binding protein